jgi:hypothetical protein
MTGFNLSNSCILSANDIYAVAGIRQEDTLIFIAVNLLFLVLVKGIVAQYFWPLVFL